MTTQPLGEPRLSPIHKFLASGIMRMILVVLGILIVLAGTSFLTTVVYSNGDLPSGTYRLHIRDTAGKPIEGARLNVYVRNQPAINYFLPTDLSISDAQGVVEFVKNASQAKTDNLGWMLFWVFPITPPVDELVKLEISAPRHETARLTETDLFKVALLNHGSAPKTKAQTYNGVVVAINLYELDVTLQDKK